MKKCVYVYMNDYCIIKSHSLQKWRRSDTVLPFYTWPVYNTYHENIL